MPELHQLVGFGSTVNDQMYQTRQDARDEDYMVKKEKEEKDSDMPVLDQQYLQDAARRIKLKPKVGTATGGRVGQEVKAPHQHSDLSQWDINKLHQAEATQLMREHGLERAKGYVNEHLPAWEIVPQHTTDLAMTFKNKSSGDVHISMGGTENTKNFVRDWTTNVAGMAGQSKKTPQVRATRETTRGVLNEFGTRLKSIGGYSKGYFHAVDAAKLPGMHPVETFGVNPAFGKEAHKWKPAGAKNVIITNPLDVVSAGARFWKHPHQNKFQIKSIKPHGGYSITGAGNEHLIKGYLPQHNPQETPDQLLDELRRQTRRSGEAIYRNHARKVLNQGGSYTDFIKEHQTTGDTVLEGEVRQTKSGRWKLTKNGRMSNRNQLGWDVWKQEAEARGIREPFTKAENKIFDAQPEVAETGRSTKPTGEDLILTEDEVKRFRAAPTEEHGLDLQRQIEGHQKPILDKMEAQGTSPDEILQQRVKHASERGGEVQQRTAAKKILSQGGTYEDFIGEFNKGQSGTVDGEIVNGKYKLKEVGPNQGRFSHRNQPAYEVWNDEARAMGKEPFTQEELRLFEKAPDHLKIGNPDNVKLSPQEIEELRNTPIDEHEAIQQKVDQEPMQIMEEHERGQQEPPEQSRIKRMGQMGRGSMRTVVNEISGLVKSGALNPINLGIGFGAGIEAAKIMDKIDPDHHIEPHIRTAMEGTLMGSQAEMFAQKMRGVFTPVNIGRLAEGGALGLIGYEASEVVGEGSKAIYKALGADETSAEVASQFTAGSAAGGLMTTRTALGASRAVGQGVSAVANTARAAAAPIGTALSESAAGVAVRTAGSAALGAVERSAIGGVARAAAGMAARSAIGAAVTTGAEMLGITAMASEVGTVMGGPVGFVAGAVIGGLIQGFIALGQALQPHTQYGLQPHYLTGTPEAEYEHLLGNDPRVRELFRQFNHDADYGDHKKNQLSQWVAGIAQQMATEGKIPQEYVDELNRVGVGLIEQQGRTWEGKDDGTEDFMVYARHEDHFEHIQRTDPARWERYVYDTSDLANRLTDPDHAPEYVQEMNNPNPNPRRHYWLLNQAIIAYVNRRTTGDLGVSSIDDYNKSLHEDWETYFAHGPYWDMLNGDQPLPYYDENGTFHNAGSIQGGKTYQEIQAMPEILQHQDWDWEMNRRIDAGEVGYDANLLNMIEHDLVYHNLMNEEVPQAFIQTQQLAINQRIREIVQESTETQAEMATNIMEYGTGILPQIDLATGTWYTHGIRWTDAVANAERDLAELHATTQEAPISNHPADVLPEHPNARFQPEEVRAAKQRRQETALSRQARKDYAEGVPSQAAHTYFDNKLDVQMEHDMGTRQYEFLEGKSEYEATGGSDYGMTQAGSNYFDQKLDAQYANTHYQPTRSNPRPAPRVPMKHNMPVSKKKVRGLNYNTKTPIVVS